MGRVFSFASSSHRSIWRVVVVVVEDGIGDGMVVVCSEVVVLDLLTSSELPQPIKTKVQAASAAPIKRREYFW